MYPLTNRIIHWATLVLVIAAFASIELRELFERGTENRELFKFIHFQIGSLLFFLTFIRLINKRLSQEPNMVEMTKLKSLAAKTVHLALIICLISMPILGVAVLIAEAKDISLIGIPLPNIMVKNKDIAHTIEEVHEMLGGIFMTLIFVHAAAAIWHHKFVKDDTLNKMLGKN